MSNKPAQGTTAYMREWREANNPPYNESRVALVAKYADEKTEVLLAELVKARGEKARIITSLLWMRGVK